MIFKHSFFKYKLNTILIAISKQKTYLKTLEEKITVLSTIKKNEYRKLMLNLFKLPDPVEHDLSLLHSNLLSYTISITITKSNFYLNISDSLGRLKLSVSSRNLFSRIEQKRKVLKPFAVNSIIKLILKQKYLKKKPLAINFKTFRWPLHVPRKLVKNLQRKRELRVVNYLLNPPFNGCRKKKVRTR
jgi:hypothetical protein